MKNHILFVDDELFYSRRYIEQLQRSAYEVTFCEDAGTALRLIEGDANMSLIILDIMMPTPAEATPEEVDHGYSTGLWLLARARDRLLQRRIPTLILTNRELSQVKERVSTMNFPPHLLQIRQKIDLPAKRLVSQVTEMLSRKAPDEP